MSEDGGALVGQNMRSSGRLEAIANEESERGQLRPDAPMMSCNDGKTPIQMDLWGETPMVVVGT